jgi:flagellar hook-associated protein 1 FlgK
MDVYQFTVVSGGKVGQLPAEGEEPITILWESASGNGTFTIRGSDPPVTPEAPVEVMVDGMLLKFFDGTLRAGDVFTVTTDTSGLPVSENAAGVATGEAASDWHWTLDSFADQFNRQAQGMKAQVTSDNRLSFSRSDTYFAIDHVEYSGSEGFSTLNTEIRVKDWSALDLPATDFRFVRSGGSWGVQNDPTGGKMTLIPEGGDDDGFGVDLTGDGIADVEILFTQRVTGDGSLEFDLVKRDSEDLSFAFSSGGSTDSGLLAVAGINTFYQGSDAGSIRINEVLRDTKYIAAAAVDSETGALSQGDNGNAIAMADVQFETFTLKQWEYLRGQDPSSGQIVTTLDGYLRATIGAMGIEARSIENSKSFAEALVSQLKEQRDAVSAVSLDEEMIKLIEFQHAFTAASKLITVADEMLNTLVSMR